MPESAPLVTLVHPPIRFSKKNPVSWIAIPPLWAACLSAVLQEEAIQHDIVDAPGEGMDQIWPLGVGFFRGLSPDQICKCIHPETKIIGLSNMFTAAWPVVRQLVREIRRTHPNALIVLGGENPTALPDIVLQESPTDVIVTGEGEESFLQLIRMIQSNLEAGKSARDIDFSGVPGLIWKDSQGQIHHEIRRNRIREIDSLPQARWDQVPLDNYFSREYGAGASRGRFLPILATRGCPYQCTYCTSPNMWTTKWFARDPILVVDELENLVKRYEVRDFQFCDLTAILNKKWVTAFCQEIIDRGLTISWQMPTGTRSEAFDEDLARLMKRAGLHTFSFALESGDKEILQKIQKKVDSQHQIRASKAAVKAGMNVVGFFMAGFPFETNKSLWNTYKLIIQGAWAGLLEISIHPFVPMPGTKEFEGYLAKGLTLNDPYYESLMDWLATGGMVSYCHDISNRHLRLFLFFSYVSFYSLSYLKYPSRPLRHLMEVFKGKGASRLARWSKGAKSIQDIRVVEYHPNDLGPALAQGS